MQLRIFLFILFNLIALNGTPAQISQEWVARYHFYSDDQARAIAVDDSGNVYVTGKSEAYTPQGAQPDYATIKYNSAGIMKWVQRYNGKGNDKDDVRAMVVDEMGNVYVTGLSNRFAFPDFDYDFATVKYDKNGVQQWVKGYNRGQDQAEAIALDSLRNIYVGGVAGGDLTVIKYNPNGDSLWVRSYNSGSSDGFEAMAVDLAGNVYLAGWDSNEFDWQIVKINSEGVFQWVRTFNGPGNGSDYPKSIAIDGSSNIYVTGYVWGNNTVNYATVKYDSSGLQKWVAYYANATALAISVDKLSNSFVTGVQTQNITTIKYNLSGVQEWIRNFNGAGNSYDMPCCIKLDDSANVYITGYATVIAPWNTDYVTIKYNSSGIQQWLIYYHGNNYNQATGLAVDKIGNVYVTGSSVGLGNNDYATIKYSQAVGIQQISNEIPREFKLHQNYPNPFNPNTKIEFEVSKFSTVKLIVFDIIGREIGTLLNDELKPGVYEINFDGNTLSSGVYYYKIIADSFSEIKKMLLIK